MLTFTVLDEIEKTLRCKPDKPSINCLSHTSPDTSKQMNKAIALASLVK
jgi:hypothetical protein